MPITFFPHDDGFGNIDISGEGSGYVHFFAGDDDVTLDGRFSISDLESILAEMKRHLDKTGD